MENKVDLQCNKIFHLEDSMVMHGVYNSDTLEDLIDTVHKLHNRTTWNEKLFSGQINNWYNYYSSSAGVQYYAINSLMFLTTVREKYVKMYERFLNQLRQYSQAIIVLSKGYLPITLLSPSKLNIILEKVRDTVQKENKDYDQSERVLFETELKFCSKVTSFHSQTWLLLLVCLGKCFPFEKPKDCSSIQF